MGERRPRGLPLAWLQAGIGIVIGGGLAVWFFFAFGFHARLFAPDVPPQAASSAPPEATAATDQPQVEPGATPGEEPSPFAAIDEVPPQPPGRSGPVSHTVGDGEVLWKIAEDYALRPETILWANDLDNPDLLLIGQQLTIPPADGLLYTIQADDRLADVAAQYGVDLADVVTANQLSNADQVVVGTNVFLPGARPVAASTSSVAQPAAPDPQQSVAAALPPVPLPENVDALLSAGWLRTHRETVLYSDRTGAALNEVPAGARLERLDGFRAGRVLVRDPGDGTSRQAMTGWANAIDLEVGRAPSSRELPLAYPTDTDMDIAHVFAPYRSQLDGSPFAQANCGPTTIGMVLDAFGISVPSRQLRAEALDAQRIWGNGVGTLITALASVVRQHGLQTVGLEEEGQIRRWPLDEIRAHIQAGHPVVVQVRYRSLPGRGGARYFGDHYILVTGVVEDGFLYNDPIDIDGIGWDRIISAERLEQAMDTNDRRYTRAAFAVSR